MISRKEFNSIKDRILLLQVDVTRCVEMLEAIDAKLTEYTEAVDAQIDNPALNILTYDGRSK